MVRVTGKEGTLAGGGGAIGATAWMARKIMRRYQLRGSVHHPGRFCFRWIYIHSRDVYQVCYTSCSVAKVKTGFSRWLICCPSSFSSPSCVATADVPTRIGVSVRWNLLQDSSY